jgi:hypothetical protein
LDNDVREAFRSWGRAKARLNGVPPQPKSIMGRIATEGPGAAIRGQAPEPLEVLLGPALMVSVAIQTAIRAHKLSDKQYEAVFLHFVCRGPVKMKAHQIRVSRQTYYERLNGGVNAIKPYLEASSGTG